MKYYCLASSQKSEDYPVKFDPKELKERLSPQQFDVTQNAGTERYINIHMPLIKICANLAACSNLILKVQCSGCSHLFKYET